MRTWAEIAGLAAATARLWVRFLPQLVTWFALGFAVNLAGRYGSALLGADQRVLATLAVGVAIIAQAVALLLMMRTLGEGLPTYRRILDQTALSRSTETTVVQTSSRLSPDLVTAVEEELDEAARRSRLQTVAVVVGPVLAIYSVWNLVSDQVRSVFILNLAQHGGGGATSFSINFSAATFYFVTAAITWALRTALGGLTRRLGRAEDAGDARAARAVRALTPVYILLEGLWVFLTFVALFIVGSDASSWWNRTVLQGWLSDTWTTLTGLLPTIVVPLPDVVRSAVSWFFTTLVPDAFSVVGLPLVFLAVTATVFGWQERRLSAAVSRRMARSQRLLRLQEGARHSSFLPTGRGARALLGLLTDDLRTRYVPLVNSLGMLFGRGLRFVGAFLVLAAAGSLGEALLGAGAYRVLGPASGTVAVTNEVVVAFVTGVVLQPVLVCLYGAAFDRALEGLEITVAWSEPPPAAASAGTASPADPWTSNPWVGRPPPAVTPGTTA